MAISPRCVEFSASTPPDAARQVEHNVRQIDNNRPPLGMLLGTQLDTGLGLPHWECTIRNPSTNPVEPTLPGLTAGGPRGPPPTIPLGPLVGQTHPVGWPQHHTAPHLSPYLYPQYTYTYPQYSQYAYPYSQCTYTTPPGYCYPGTDPRQMPQIQNPAPGYMFLQHYSALVILPPYPRPHPANSEGDLRNPSRAPSPERPPSRPPSPKRSRGGPINNVQDRNLLPEFNQARSGERSEMEKSSERNADRDYPQRSRLVSRENQGNPINRGPSVQRE